jgi:hypothetical protein
MKDKRDECGCHRDCHVFCLCPNRCEWPECLTDEEATELENDIMTADHPDGCCCPLCDNPPFERENTDK